MNRGFFLGKVLSIGKFKFIYGENLIHKSMIELTVELFDGNIVIFRGYDNIADYILQNEFEFVYIEGILRTEGFLEIIEIEVLEISSCYEASFLYGYRSGR